MGRNPFGIEDEKEGSFEQTLFYFFREFKINPFDEEYEVRNSKGEIVYKITKKGLSIPLFNSLLSEMEEHYKKEKEEMNKASKKK